MGLKSVFGKIGRKISGAFRGIVDVSQELFGRAWGSPDLIFGWLLENLYSKKLRLTVVILTRPDGTLTTSVAEAERSIEHAEKTLKSGANITFRKKKVRIINTAAPPYVLRVEDGIYVLGDLFQAAGNYFQENSESGDLTAFVIDDVIGKVGISIFLADFVLLDNDGITRGSTLVHEIGHACGLTDWNYSDNFMKTPSSINANQVKWWQSNILRSSRYVGYS